MQLQPRLCHTENSDLSYHHAGSSRSMNIECYKTGYGYQFVQIIIKLEPGNDPSIYICLPEQSKAEHQPEVKE